MNDWNEKDLNETGLPAAEPAPLPQSPADGPAPAAPQPPAAAAPAPCPPPVRPAKEPVRRVGTVTLGVALILTGLCITASFMLPGFDILTVAKLAPLVLVALGCETLWAAARKGKARLKYDFLSAFVCFVLICASLCAAAVPVLWKHYGPQRDFTEQRLQQQLTEQLYPQLSGMDVSDCSAWVNLGSAEFDPDMTLADLQPQDYVEVSVRLNGAYQTTGEFAAAAQQVLAVLQKSGVRQAHFYSETDADRWEVSMNGTFGMQADADAVAQEVSHSIWVTDASGESLWYDAEAWANKEAYEAEMRRQMAQQQADEQAYQQGWQDALAEYGIETADESAGL